MLAWQWKTWFSDFSNSEDTWTFLEDWGTLHCHHEFLDIGVFSGTLKEGKAACPLSKYPQTPTTESLLCLICSIPSLVPLVTDSCPGSCLPLPSDYRGSCHARSWETRWSTPLPPKNCLSHDTSVLTVKIKLYRLSMGLMGCFQAKVFIIQDLWDILAAQRILFLINIQCMYISLYSVPGAMLRPLCTLLW